MILIHVAHIDNFSFTEIIIILSMGKNSPFLSILFICLYHILFQQGETPNHLVHLCTERYYHSYHSAVKQVHNLDLSTSVVVRSYIAILTSVSNDCWFEEGSFSVSPALYCFKPLSINSNLFKQSCMNS